MVSSVPNPRPVVAVAHSPTPSTVRIAASVKGEQKNALAAWDWWCSTNRMRSSGTPTLSRIPALDPELVEHPGRHRLAKHRVRSRRGRNRAAHDAIELDQGLFEEGDVVDLAAGDAASFEAEPDRPMREAVVVFNSAETFFLRRRRQITVLK
jgi:hypothetical protein